MAASPSVTPNTFGGSDAILQGATLKQVQAAARRNQMTLLVEHGLRKFASGMTSIQEVLRVVAPEKGEK